MLPEIHENYFRDGGSLKSIKKYGRYRYKVFGLPISSDILLPELLTAIDTCNVPEVSVSLGKLPSGITNDIEKTEGFHVAKNRFLFYVPGVGGYYVTNGSEIVVEPIDRADERFLRLFLLGTAFGALLMQRGILPLHGSAIVVNGGCAIFTGVSGAGKSTLLTAFRERGYDFLTDDVAAVTIDEYGMAWVHPAYPQQKLWRDTMDNMGVNTVISSPFIAGINKDKFVVPAKKGFHPSPAPLVAVYELETERRRNAVLHPLSSIDKLAVLVRHTYRSWLIDGLGLKKSHFKQCAAIARKVVVARLTRPEGVFSTEEQVRLVQRDLARLQTGKIKSTNP